MNWKNEAPADRFARLFDHGRMRACCSRVSSRPLPDDPAGIQVATDLKLFAEAFSHTSAGSTHCDYEIPKYESRTEAWEMIVEALDAMTAWSGIRESAIARHYLLDLLGTSRVCLKG